MLIAGHKCIRRGIESLQNHGLCHFLTNRCSRTYSSPAIKKVIFSGIQPTGVPHIGNYLGALKQWVNLQKESSPTIKLFFSIVDLHAITVRQDPEQLRLWRKETLATLLAVGLDPARVTIFYQSDVPAHAELMWILSCTASIGYLSRMTQWKSKLSLPESATSEDSNVKARLKLGLFSYPVLQAADILVHGATHVPVGEDQAQHLEFARECASNFNNAYEANLTEPQMILSPAKRIMSLRSPHQKMSKSHPDPRSRILLSDTEETIHSKLKSALTDSIPGISYDPQTRPGVSNLLEIWSYLEDDERKITCEELAGEISGSSSCSGSGMSMRVFKERVAGKVWETVGPIRARYLELMGPRGEAYLREVADKGAGEARRNADGVMDGVRRSIGL
ncbi:Tryptophan--tRNA ligase, mitochondrial [Bachmanniomyces sp. S44760]|nr:Tryptophan--tRNA ligase, mitochondrial [Bachmanniomyces sp. S44760]